MRFVKLLLLLALAALGLAACGGQSAEPQVITEVVQIEVTRTETQIETVVETVVETVTERVVETVQVIALPAVDPLAVRGDIITAGSSTVFPLTERMAERFQREGFAGRITIDSIGSGAGLSRFCVAGESDIANASRPIRDSEVESCRAIGREPLEFRVGTDALAVTVSTANDFVYDVTLEELNLIFGTAATWSDVRSEWPNQPILRFIPGTDSGTFDYFVEEIFDSNEEDILGASNLQLSEDDNVLVQGVQGSPFAVGFFGYAYYEENRDTLRVLGIEGVEATDENVENGTYPLARPLFIYSTAAIMQAKPQVAAFINFYLTYVQEEVLSVGYFPASTAALNVARERWLTGNLMAVERPAVSGIILPPVDPLAVTGDIITAGSSTVFPLTERMAERFQREGYGGRITIDSIGSGAGLSRFCVAGESDIANASRPIRESERESCRAIGREPIEFRVGTDALAVVVSAANDFVTDVTMEELNLIFGTASSWSDVRAEWPNQPILRFIPGTDSGTFDYFVEEVFDSNEEDILGASNLQLSEDDNVLVQGVQGSPFAVGFFGYAYYEENRDTLRVLNIEGVEATDDNVENGTYPLARPLFIYSTATIMQAKSQVAAFINFYLTYVQEEVLSVGYFPASEDALNLAKFNWINANN
jgi:phosphate transport system substrate-binding protein